MYCTAYSFLLNWTFHQTRYSFPYFLFFQVIHFNFIIPYLIIVYDTLFLSFWFDHMQFPLDFYTLTDDFLAPIYMFVSVIFHVNAAYIS